jgi:hypothetical protein
VGSVEEVVAGSIAVSLVVSPNQLPKAVIGSNMETNIGKTTFNIAFPPVC